MFLIHMCLPAQCRAAVEKLSTKRLKPSIKCGACAVLLDMTTFPGGISGLCFARVVRAGGEERRSGGRTDMG